MPRPRSEICDLKVPFPTERSVIPALLSVARFYPTAFGPAAVVRTNHDRQPHPGAAQNLGAGRAAPDEIARLYHQAFRDFGTPALWSRLPSTTPTIAQALVIAENLRREGNLQSRALAGEIEQACRAAL